MNLRCVGRCGILVGILMLITVSGFAQEQTVGVFVNEPGAYPGYTLFAPVSSTTTYLIDMEGRLVHSWTGEYRPGNSVYLQENGSLLKTCNQGNLTFTAGGSGGRIRELDWEGNLIWDFRYSNPLRCQHHDVESLPNGNVLMIAWESKSEDDAIQAGRNPSLVSDQGLWPDTIIEVEPDGLTGGTVIWEWHVWDHLVQDFDATKANFGVVADHPELIDINHSRNTHPDWNHTNGIDYNAAFDQIIVSVRAFSEFWVIDHSTTTAEAAGHSGGNSGKGGDLLYRWGNPQAYGEGTAADQKLFVQHDATWIPDGYPGAGNILVFNNGAGRPDGDYSSADEIVPPVDGIGNYAYTPGEAFGPAEAAWSYTATPVFDFYSSHISGAQRLVNGNTLVCEGATGRFFEVTQTKDVVWEYVNPVTKDGPLTQGDPLTDVENQVFRCTRYGTDYAAFVGRDLTPGDPLEIDPTSVEPEISMPVMPILHPNYPNPFNPETTIAFELASVNNVTIDVFNAAGRVVRRLVDGSHPAGVHTLTWDGTDDEGRSVVPGLYICRLRTGETVLSRKMLLVE